MPSPCPAFGIKIDAVPGRLNETWFKAEEEGIYFGQCSELCGKNHSYMPITVKVVSQEAYDTWLNWAIDEYGGTRPEAPRPAPRRPPSRRAEPPRRPRPAGSGGRRTPPRPAAEARRRREPAAEPPPPSSLPPSRRPSAAEEPRCGGRRRRAGAEPAPAN